MTKHEKIQKITLTAILAALVVVIAFLPIKTFGIRNYTYGNSNCDWCYFRRSGCGAYFRNRFWYCKFLAMLRL